MDKCTSYAKKVVSGKIVAGKLVIKSCKRHLSDLKKSKKNSFKYEYREDIAERVISFFSTFLKHSKGKEWAGKPLELEEWQCYIIGCTFGWVNKKTGLRRFRTSFNMVARKNGKSTISAGVGLYGLVADQEPGAEIYTAAVKRDQAKIIFGEACRMAKASEELLEVLEVLTNNINFKQVNSKFEPLSSDTKSLDGLNTHIGLIDELHAHPNRKVYDLVFDSTASRSQPLMFIVSTAGEETKGNICYEIYEYAQSVLDGVIDDDTFFCFIAQIDKEDDWRDESVWIKANPSLGKACKIEYLRARIKTAKESPSARANFLRKHMNIFVEGHTKWMDMDKWNKVLVHPQKIPDITTANCYIGADLSTVGDLCSLGFVFPFDNYYAIKSHSFMPEELVEEKSRLYDVPLEIWAQEGYLSLTPGYIVDYNYIIEYIEYCVNKLCWNVVEICYDKWNANQFARDLEAEGFTMVDVPQNVKRLSEPTKGIENLVISKQLMVEKNPLLSWAVSNAAARLDANENIMLNKSKSGKKIDPIAAVINAFSRAMFDKVNYSRGSVYDERGFDSF